MNDNVNNDNLSETSPAALTVEKIFIDVDEKSWYRGAVQFVYENGLLLGTDSQHFSPNLAANRGMIATVLYRMSNADDSPISASASGIFADVADSSYYAKAVKWAADENILTGYGNGMFMPERNITREELAVILWRYTGSPSIADNTKFPYADMQNTADWSKDALLWAAEEGILVGRTDTSLAPSAYATRAEISVILMRFAEFLDMKKL